MADLPFTLDQLRILRAIASEGSFKKAADSLYVTQPAVSLQIQNLEKQLNVSLFDRGGRKAQLTEAGHLLLLQVLDLQAYRRLRHIQAVGRFFEAALAGDRSQDAQLIKGEGQISHAGAQGCCGKQNSRGPLGDLRRLRRISPLLAPAGL